MQGVALDPRLRQGDASGVLGGVGSAAVQVLVLAQGLGGLVGHLGGDGSCSSQSYHAYSCLAFLPAVA